MSVIPTDSEPYYEMEVIKENIGEVGITVNETKIQNWGDESDREIDTELIYLFTTFPLTEALVVADEHDANVWRQIRQLSNERTEGKFWQKTNSDDTLLKKSDENIKLFVEKLTQIPATVE